MRGRIVLTCTALILITCFCACGVKKPSPENSARHAYTVLRFPFDGGKDFYSVQALDGYFYYLDGTGHEAEEGSHTQTLMRHAFKGNAASEKLFSVPVSENLIIAACPPGQNGDFLFLMEEKRHPEDDMPEPSADRLLFLRKYNASGELLWDADITAYLEQNREDAPVSELAADTAGNLFLASGSRLFLLDASGKLIGKTETGAGNIVALLPGQDGNLYAAYQNSAQMPKHTKLARLDASKKELAPLKNFPECNLRHICQAVEKPFGNYFLFTDNAGIYAYHPDTGVSEQLLDWLDYNIIGGNAEKISASDDGQIAVLLRDWNTGSSEIILLREAIWGNTPDKMILTLGVIYNADSSSLQKMIADFNNSNSTYRVELKRYLSGNDYAAACSRLELDILSGSGPDLISLEQLNISKLAAGGVLEDLTPYLEQSSVLDREDYFENLLDSATFDGKLVTIPSRIEFTALAGKVSELGEQPGWTLQEVLACAESRPDSKLLDLPRALLLSDLLCFNMELFLDPANAECRFDTPEFQDLLRFAARYPGWSDWPPERSGEESPLLQRVLFWGGDFSCPKNMEKNLGEPVNYIGFPNPDGEQKCLLRICSPYAISAVSQKKEGAWAFLEYQFSHDTTTDTSTFPGRRSEYERLAWLARSDHPLDAYGNLLLRNGYPVTQKETDLIEELILSSKTPVLALDTPILDIIMEEAEGFWEGDKSVEEAVAIIQNRARLYLLEQ